MSVYSPDQIAVRFSKYFDTFIEQYEDDEADQVLSNFLPKYGQSSGINICANQVDDSYIQTVPKPYTLWVAYRKKRRKTIVVGFAILSHHFDRNHASLYSLGDPKLNKLHLSELSVLCSNGGVGSLLLLIAISANPEGTILEIGYNPDVEPRVFSKSAYNLYTKFEFVPLTNMKHRTESGKNRLFMIKTGGVDEEYIQRITSKVHKRRKAPVVYTQTHTFRYL